MKKFLYALFLILGFTTACSADSQSEIQPGKIYMFYSNSCPHCHDALQYINRKYPYLNLTMINVANPEGYQLLIKCARKFNLGQSVGTPLFCADNRHLMGWSPAAERDFDQLVKPYLKK